MRIVADTNTVVSGLLWYGPPREVLDQARSGTVELFTSPALLAELEDVLGRGKFVQRLALAGVTPRELVLGYAALATVLKTDEVATIIEADPDDDQVLACAAATQVEVIVSGDKHLLDLKRFQGIPILTAVELLARLEGTEA